MIVMVWQIEWQSPAARLDGSGSCVSFSEVQLQSDGSESVPGSSPDIISLLEFKRSSPQALGTVQILVAVMLFLYGVTVAFYDDTSGSPSVRSTGVFVWAPLSYIIAGSLTVAADSSMSRCMIKGSMAMNIVAAVVSCAATILYIIDAVTIYRFQSLSVFNLLVFIISISVSVFGCKATCRQPNTPTLQAVVVGNHLPPDADAFPHSLPEETYYSEVDHTLSEPLLPKAVGSTVG